ncbi:MAG TPA: signal peptidase II [Elusimicrobiales bacterium]|nr:signal peptidase II [Elusimicrobiales bacterium]
MRKLLTVPKINFKVWEIITLLSILAFDRMTKIIVCAYPLGYSKKVFSFFYFTYVRNTGAAFGMGKGFNLVFVFIAVVLIVGVLYYKNYIAGFGFKAKIATLFILSGAAGNLFDRIFYGYVIDFLDFRIWPVFNVADSFISVGGVLLAFVFLLGGKDSGKNEK